MYISKAQVPPSSKEESIKNQLEDAGMYEEPVKEDGWFETMHVHVKSKHSRGLHRINKGQELKNLSGSPAKDSYAAL